MRAKFAAWSNEPSTNEKLIGRWRQIEKPEPDTPIPSDRKIIWLWFKKWSIMCLKLYFKAFVTIAFLMFILEEGSQLLGFSRFTLIGGKLWDEANQAVIQDEKITRYNRKLCKIGMWINPISGFVFVRYFDQELIKISREKKRVDRELNGKKEVVTSTLVHITSYGTRFHRETCSSIAGKRTSKYKREKAVVYGLDPCKRCKP